MSLEKNQLKSDEVRERLKAIGARQWQLAAVARISEFSLCRWLRADFLTEQQSRLIAQGLNEMEYAKQLERGTKTAVS